MKVTNTRHDHQATPTRHAANVRVVSTVRCVLQRLLRIIDLPGVLNVRHFILRVSSVAMSLRLTSVQGANATRRINDRLVGAHFTRPSLYPFSTYRREVINVNKEEVLPTTNLRPNFLLQAFRRVQLTLQAFRQLHLSVRRRTRRHLVSMLPRGREEGKGRRRTLFPTFNCLLTSNRLLERDDTQGPIMVEGVNDERVRVLQVFRYCHVSEVLVVALREREVCRLERCKIRLRLLQNGIRRSLYHDERHRRRRRYRSAGMLPCSALVRVFFLFARGIRRLSVFRVTLRVIIGLRQATSYEAAHVRRISDLRHGVLTSMQSSFVRLMRRVTQATFLRVLTISIRVRISDLSIARLLSVRPFTSNNEAIRSLNGLPELSDLSRLLLRLTNNGISTRNRHVVVTINRALQGNLTRLTSTRRRLNLVLCSSRVVQSGRELTIIRRYEVDLNGGGEAL